MSDEKKKVFWCAHCKYCHYSTRRGCWICENDDVEFYDKETFLDSGCEEGKET